MVTPLIVVTGGAGFLGSNLLRALEARADAELVLCDRFGRDAKWRNVAKRNLCDLIAPEALPDFLTANARQVQGVFHLGAISSTTESDVDLLLAENFAFSRRLWERCVRLDLRLIYASSAATYGDGAHGFDDDPDPSALARLRPLNPYGWTKHLFDRRAVSAWSRPLQWVGLKFFNVFGPHEYHKGEMRSVLAKHWERIHLGEEVALFAGGPNQPHGPERDFIHVDDAVDVMMWFWDNDHVSGLFNCGTGTARSFYDLIATAFRAAGHQPNIRFREIPSELAPQYQGFTQATTARLRAAGYDRPFTPLETAVESYVRVLAGADPYL